MMATLKSLKHWVTFIRYLSQPIGGFSNTFGDAYRQTMMGSKLSSLADLQNTPAYKAVNRLYNYIEAMVNLSNDKPGYLERLEQSHSSSDIGMHEFVSVSLFQRNGSNVLCPSPSLVKMFMETKVDFPINQLKFPFTAFYIQLPDGDFGLNIPTGVGPRKLDGFYVSWTEEDNTSFRDMSGEYVVVPGFNRPVLKSALEQMLATGKLPSSLQDKLQKLVRPFSQEQLADGNIMLLTGIARDGLSNEHEDFTCMYHKLWVPDGHGDSSWEDRVDETVKEEAEQGDMLKLFGQRPDLDPHDGLKTSLIRLVINLVLYMNQAPGEPSRDVEEVTDPQLINWKREKQRKPVSQLQGLCQSLISSGPINEIKLGHKLEIQLQQQREQIENDATKRSVKCHWRRGHWHRYWLGARDATDRKLMPRWIQPVLVAGDQPDTTHQYSIE
jgi:hypothetical protein